MESLKKKNAEKYRNGETYKRYVQKNQEKLTLIHNKYQSSKRGKGYHHEWYLKNKARLKPLWAEKARKYRAENREAYNIWDKAYRVEYRKLEKAKITKRHYRHKKTKNYSFEDCLKCEQKRIMASYPSRQSKAPMFAQL